MQHLVELGLVDRTPDPADGRATLLSASDDAVRRLDDVADAAPATWLDERLGDWSDDDLAASSPCSGATTPRSTTGDPA